MRLKTIFILLFFIFYIFGYYVNYLNKEHQVSKQLDKSVQELKLHYNITNYHNKKTADDLYFTLSTNETIIDNLSKALNASIKEKTELRKELYEILSKRFSALKLKGVKILLFSQPNNKIFLRMHRPDKFGDDISLVNKIQVSLHGFEEGKISHAFRNIYPVFDKKGTYLGSFDVSFSSESMQQVLDDVNKIHSHFLVSKDVINKKIWKTQEVSSEYKKSIEHEMFLISEKKDVNHEKIDISKETIDNNKKLIDEKINASKEFAIVGTKNDDLIVISFLPIKSITGKKASAYFVSYTQNQEIKKILTQFRWINIFSFFAILIISYLIYRQIMHKEELAKEVDIKTKELKELNENLEKKVEEETLKNRDKDKQLYEHAKNAQMGEMIGNIAHQWRQPLSLISTISSAEKLKIQVDLFEKDEAVKQLDTIINTVNHLSRTIDTFRDYLKDTKELKKVYIQDRLDYAITIIKASLNNDYIELINEVDYEEKVEVEIILGELSQVLINIFTNSKDALISKDIDKKWIKVGLYKKYSYVVITIEDNAGGIPEDILSKIYDPYFTTKHQSQGTGIGLYMSRQIVHKHLNGKLYEENTENGAKFFIELPIK